MSLTRRLVMRSARLAVGRPAHQRWARSWEESTSSGSDVGARLKKWYKKRRDGCDLKNSFSAHLEEHERGISHNERIVVPFVSFSSSFFFFFLSFFLFVLLLLSKNPHPFAPTIPCQGRRCIKSPTVCPQPSFRPSTTIITRKGKGKEKKVGRGL